MRHEIFWIFFVVVVFGGGEGKFRIHSLLQKLGFNFNRAVSAASHCLWIFFIFLQIRKEKSEYRWKRRTPREICESHSQEIWKNRGGKSKRRREKSLRSFKSQIPSLPFFIHCDETGWLTATIPKPGFPTQNLWKRGLLLLFYHLSGHFLPGSKAAANLQIPQCSYSENKYLIAVGSTS